MEAIIIIPIISVLSVLVVILGFIVYNLLRKVEKSEDILLGYLDYLDKIDVVIKLSHEKLKQLDIKGSFRSDDEVGFFFEGIKQIQKVLDNFQIQQIKIK